jgi:hypothetical protein
LFEDERQERDFTVRGGLLWFHHVLVVAVEVDRTFQVSDREQVTTKLPLSKSPSLDLVSMVWKNVSLSTLSRYMRLGTAH